MIARFWRGATRPEDADAYVEYLRETGLKEYRQTPGNKAAYVLRRIGDGRAEFVTLSFWDSADDIRGFAGDDIEHAVFYPQDDRFLIERELTVDHFDVVAGDAETDP